MENDKLDNSSNLCAEAKDLLLNLANQNDSTKQITQANSANVEVGDVTSSAAKLYERIRNSVDYRESYLLRRSAIERMLSRRFNAYILPDPLAVGLVKELLRAGYISESQITQEKITEIASIANRYLNFIKAMSKTSREYFLGIASAEIDDCLMKDEKENILFDFFTKIISRDLEKIKYPTSKWSNKEERIKIALYLYCYQFDLPTIRYFLFKDSVPNWQTFDQVTTPSEIHGKLLTSKLKVEHIIKQAKTTELSKIIQVYNPLIITINDIYKQNPQAFDKILISKNRLQNEISFVVSNRYLEIKKRLLRSITRATFFIFVTKIFFAVLLELPYDLFIISHVDYLPLVINLLIPPVLMILTYFLVYIPDENNTEKLIDYIQSIIYNGDLSWLEEKIYPKKRSNSFTNILNIMYIISFLIILSLVIWILRLLNFTIVSGAIFFFFISVVSFFAFRIRMSANEIVVTRKKESFLASIIDYFLLPFLGFGKWLSVTFTNFNVFIFILDFIIEAPFKTILEVIEHWSEFIKEKKDDIINQ